MKIISLLFIALIFSRVCVAQDAISHYENPFDKYSLSHSWQKKIAEKPQKTILDYYMLIPTGWLEGEDGFGTNEGQKDTYEYRMESVKKSPWGCLDQKNGFLKAAPDANICMALFKDKIHNRDVIAFVEGCGEMPVQSCNYLFITFDEAKKEWRNVNDLFPYEEMGKRCKFLEKHKTWDDDTTVEPYLKLPEFGTTIKIMDTFSDDEHLLFVAKWNGERFVLSDN